ncbi:TolC family protein [Methylovorus sp. MM2]|uniref:TolC family protein n=1 Tax=Methylovorus sp. MM2 TaxID=1848038 RepID=UPI000AB360B7|nr:TolC family protein [Methylovorus sp. MM2]
MKATSAVYGAGIAFVCLLLVSCGFQSYTAKPIDPSKIATRYLKHDPDSVEFREFLIASGYPENRLPITQWGESELTYVALFFNPQLDVARAQWRAAMASGNTARQRPIPAISSNVENHSQRDGGVSPWTYGLGIDIPIETAGKREARIDRANNLSEAARIEIAQTAWQVRSLAINALIDYLNADYQVQAMQSEVSLRQDIVSMLDARLKAGMVSTVESSNARLQLQKAQQGLAAVQGQIPALRASLAGNAGLPLAIFKQLNIESVPISALNSKKQTIVFDDAVNAEFQEAALLNRLDIRAALARYAAAEAKLRLEIAKQYPDIIASPGYSYDQGDRIWSLGLSGLLTLINKNRALIAEAQSLREVEAAQFEALQANIISELEKAKANYQSAQEELVKAQQFLDDTEARSRQIQNQFDAGYADRLELTTTKLENILALQNLINTSYKAQRALARLEDVIQRPLNSQVSSPINIEDTVNRASLNIEKR